MNKKKVLIKIGKIIQYIILSIMVLICIGNLIMLFQKYACKKQVPMLFNYAFIQIEDSAGSMVNEDLLPGDVILIKKLKNDEYKVGMIITFIDDTNLVVTHKIIERNDETVTTQGQWGDNPEGSSGAKEIVKIEQIVGAKVSGNLKTLGKTITFLRSPLGIIIILLVGFIIIEAPSVIEQITNRKQNNDEKDLNEENEKLKAEIDALKKESKKQEDENN